ncbi:MAG: UvrD-helicase domain-containing protein, partial [Lachnospiraceae bacterium]|nr:UvrD-helicase domain-containing protein [Lachnospiraceae bacterium]
MKASEKELRDALSLKNSEVGCKNYSIKAGAGGGKTTLLSARICRQIVLGTPIDKFVIITYTNAAAAELRDKISARLTEFIKAPDSSGKQLENAKEALASIELMQISTIHAFLLKILKEYAFETGIALDVKMLEEEEDNERKTGFFNSWYSDHYDEIQEYKWIHTTKEEKEIDVTREIFLNMFMDIANVREVISYDTSDHTALLEERAEKYVTDWLPKLVVFKNELLANRPKNKDGTIPKLNKGPQSIADYISEVEGSLNTGIDEARKLSNAIGLIKGIVDDGSQFYGKKWDASQLESFIPVIPEWELEWNFEELYNFMLDSSKATEIVDYVCRIQSEYQKKNDAETLSLSNDDILFRSKKLIAEHPEVLDKLREKYEKIYVDEFQDTTGLQAGIVKMLSEKPGTVPEANDLQNDKLIFVGDPKQSIYRFTGAEKAVYDEMDAMLSKRPSSVAESVALDTNFRSNKTIVDWVNDKFKKLMPGSYSPMDTDWMVSEKEALHGVFKYVPEIGVDDKGNPNKYTKIHDTEKTAELIKKLVDNDKIFIEKPNRNEDGSFGTPSLCKIQYSDIMVVTKNTTKMKEYVEKFAECGIPVIVQGKFSVESDEILKNFILLTQYLAEPKNRKNRMEAIQVITGMDVTKADADEIKKAGECLRELRTFFREHSMDAASIMRYLLSREDMFLPRNKTFNRDDVKKYRIRLNQMVET